MGTRKFFSAGVRRRRIPGSDYCVFVIQLRADRDGEPDAEPRVSGTILAHALVDRRLLKIGLYSVDL